MPPPRASSGEPEGTVTILKWEQDSGMTVHKDFLEIARGKILNFPKQAPDTGKTHGKPPKGTVDFMTDAVVVDMTGGGTSGDMLLLNKDGKLVAHDATEDTDALKKFLAAVVAPQVPPGGPGRVGPTPGTPSGVNLEHFMDRVRGRGPRPKN